MLDDAFAARTLAEWKPALADALGVWAVCQEPLELHDDPQALENGYLVDVATDEGTSFTLVANPVQFDETPPVLTRAPEPRRAHRSDPARARNGVGRHLVVEGGWRRPMSDPGLGLPDDLVTWMEEIGGGKVTPLDRKPGGGRKEAWFVDLDRAGRRGVAELFLHYDRSDQRPPRTPGHFVVRPRSTAP